MSQRNRPLTLVVVALAGLGLVFAAMCMAADDFGEAVAVFAAAVLVVAMIIISLLMASLPAAVAVSRRHRQRAAIIVCNLVGLVIWPAWPVALIWAFTANVRTPDPPQPATPAPPPPVDGPGSYRVAGVDRESGLDTELVVNAQSRAAAKVKAELQGMHVVSVEPAAPPTRLPYRVHGFDHQFSQRGSFVVHAASSEEAKAAAIDQGWDVERVELVIGYRPPAPSGR